MKLTHGSRHDVHLLQPGRWMKGRLLIFDLGFYRATLFREIDRHAGYFLSCMKKDGNPVVLKGHRRSCSRSIKLRELQETTHDDIFDVQAELGYALHHPQRPFVTNRSVRWRCVAIYNAGLDQWHRYVNNMPPAMMKAEHFTAVYAARWEVELLFRELKCTYRIGQIPSANPHVTEAHAALLTLVLSRRLYPTMTQRWRLPSRRIPFDRWARRIRTIAHDPLDIVLSRRDRAYRQRRIEHFLRAQARDPNRNRVPLPHRAQLGIYQPA